MDRKTLEDVKAAFSLLPAELAQEAEAELLGLHARGGVSQALLLKWSEHDERGAFLRGGLSDILDHSTRLVTNSQDQTKRSCSGRSSRAPARTLFSRA